MTIGIDAGPFSSTDDKSKLGVYRVALNTLAKVSRKSRDLNYLLYTFQDLSEDVLERFGENVSYIKLRPVKFWQTIRLSVEIIVERPDIFISFSQSLPLCVTSPSILYVHDLAFELFPKYYRGTHRKLSWQTKHAVRKASKIVAVSYKTKEDLVRLYHVDENKIEVIYHGASSRFAPNVSGSADILDKYGIKKDYFLFVGGFKKIKNIVGIISGYSYFVKKTKRNCNLLMIGPDLGEYKQAVKMVEKNKLKDKVFIYDYIEDEYLPAIYSEAVGFVSPSFYEGFGLTHLEAMASGLPVVGSNRGSLPEIIDKAGILVDPAKSEEIGEAMVEIVADERERLRLKKKAVAQAQKFSWEDSVVKLIRLIKEVGK